MTVNEDEKWEQRRLQHIAKNYGLKRGSVRNQDLGEDGMGACNVDGGIELTIRKAYSDRVSSSNRTPICRSQSAKESALHIVWQSFNSLLNGDLFRQLRKLRSNNSSKANVTLPNGHQYASITNRKSVLANQSFPHARLHQELQFDEENHINDSGLSENRQPNVTFSHSAPPISSINDDNHDNEHSPHINGQFPNTLTFHQSGLLRTHSDLTYSRCLSFADHDQNKSLTNGNGNSVCQKHHAEKQIDDASDGNVQTGRSSKFLTLDLFGDLRFRQRIGSLIKYQFSNSPVDETVKNLPMYGRFRHKSAEIDYFYRPLFTYWVTFVQILVMIYHLLVYGIGTDFSNFFGVIEHQGDVMTPSGSFAHIVVWEQNNLWIGPRFVDLVHAGAKYSPCMRHDSKIYDQILRERREEADHTGCCIYHHGCFQTSECSKQFAQFIKWSTQLAAPRNPVRSRIVCGQDPQYCKKPRSPYYTWSPVDISKWPICQEKSRNITSAAKHMHCELTGHPCCIQMHGQCRITTQEYCNFVRGYYHPEATLCSQVSCLNDVCGITPFFTRDNPDQFYRLATPLFIHAGIIRCIITIILQMTIMRRFEELIGWIRLSTIYFLSGIAGYLASSIFVPYMPEVGPAGSQGGVLGALIVNIVWHWHIIENPFRVLFLHLFVALILFATGFLPYVDNWAQLFGFLLGCILAAALLPYIRLRRLGRIAIILCATGITALFFIAMFVLFFTGSLDFDLLKFLNCPMTSSRICDHQGLMLRSWVPI